MAARKPKAQPPRTQAPSGLSDRGLRLWAEVVEAKELNPGELVLLEEACRIADRLDVLAGWGDEGWAEARQQTQALRLVIGQLDLPKAEAEAEEASPLDELRARRDRNGKPAAAS